MACAALVAVAAEDRFLTLDLLKTPATEPALDTRQHQLPAFEDVTQASIKSAGEPGTQQILSEPSVGAPVTQHDPLPISNTILPTNAGDRSTSSLCPTATSAASVQATRKRFDWRSEFTSPSSSSNTSVRSGSLRSTLGRATTSTNRTSISGTEEYTIEVVKGAQGLHKSYSRLYTGARKDYQVPEAVRTRWEEDIKPKLVTDLSPILRNLPVSHALSDLH